LHIRAKVLRAKYGLQGSRTHHFHSDCYDEFMQLYINGESRNIADVPTLAALIENLGIKSDRVAVELNRDIVQRANWKETPLKDGDRLEIVHFVGGGRNL
jgi:thiamine biosynthesis protein ThiS